MKIAFVFPGQGAQKAGMGKTLFDTSQAARAVFERADAALGEPLSDLIFEGPDETLTLTANTQPAIVTVSMAAHAAFKEQSDVSPAYLAGHSLGEFSALAAAGSLCFEDAVRITRVRGLAMQEAVSPGVGAMAAIIGLDPVKINQICDEIDGTVSPANDNAPGQVVISGHRDAVQSAGEAMHKAGAKKVIPLQVSAPFHCALMAPAAQKLEAALGEIQFNPLEVPVVTNVEAAPNSDASRCKSLLVSQVTAQVRWTESVRFMLDEGVDTFVEFGPGTVLSGLIRRIERNATVISVNSPIGLDKAVKALEKLN